jgi:hypothetical protein
LQVPDHIEVMSELVAMDGVPVVLVFLSRPVASPPRLTPLILETVRALYVPVTSPPWEVVAATNAAESRAAEVIRPLASMVITGTWIVRAEAAVMSP